MFLDRAGPSRYVFFLRENISQIVQFCLKSRKYQSSQGYCTSNSSTTLYFLSIFPTSNKSSLQLKIQFSLSFKTYSREGIFFWTNLMPLSTASTLSSSMKNGLSIDTVVQDTAFSVFPPQNLKVPSLKVSQTYQLTTSLSYSFDWTKSLAIMPLTPWYLLTWADSLKYSQEILAINQCLSISAVQSQWFGMNILGMSDGCVLLFSQWKVSLYMVTFCPFFVKYIAVKYAETPAPRTAHQLISLVSDQIDNILTTVYPLAYPMIASSWPYPQL